MGENTNSHGLPLTSIYFVSLEVLVTGENMTRNLLYKEIQMLRHIRWDIMVFKASRNNLPL